ncbi:MAG TPA: helix-turn-helix domain-containing protein [Terriglobia bacterium]|nr:helix-turn-helix domain-containing protein [Terriglobia bacterium]
MRIVSATAPRSRYLERGAAELSRQAHKRLQWFDHYQSHARNAALTCRYFGISRQTFYRWKQRYDPQALNTLGDRSHRPHHRRRPPGRRSRRNGFEVCGSSTRAGARISWRCSCGGRVGSSRSPWSAAS